MARRGRDTDAARRQRIAEQQAQRQAQEQLIQQGRQAQEQMRDERLAETYAVDTGISVCPNCGSRNLIRTRASEGDEALQTTACCVGCLVWWPALILIPFLSRRYNALHCRACEYEWPA